MTWPELVVVFTVCWWLIFLMALPIGVRPDDHPVPGSVPSAPARPRLRLKVVVTTLLALLACVAASQIAASGLIAFRPPPELQRPAPSTPR